MSRGLTLIEMLLSLAIVSGMMIVAIGWMQSADTASASARKELTWRIAAAAAMQVIHDDLATGDFELTRRGNTQPKSRVIVENDVLSIITRSGGKPMVHVYSLDASILQMRRSSEETSRILLREVDDFICEHDEDEGVLIVTIRRSDQALTRRFNL